MFFLGRLGRDAEVRHTQAGDVVVSLAVAYPYGRKGDDGRRPSEWVSASFWGKRAEAVAPYLTKGSQVLLTLEEVHIETFEGKNGPGHKLVGRVTDLELASSRDNQAAPAPRPASAPQPRPAPAPASSGFDDMSDDIPF